MDETRIPKIVLIAIVVVLAVGGVVGAYFAWEQRSKMEEDEQVFCTQEAKQCSDGSYAKKADTYFQEMLVLARRVTVLKNG